MNTKDIKQLIEILETSGLEALTYKNDQFEIQLKKPSLNTQVVVPQNVATPVQTTADEAVRDAIKSPLVGVYYGKPTPESAPFISAGQSVKEGDVLCIIEAMKVMNEIKATRAGVIQEVLLGDGDTVDFDQPMFVLA